MSQSYSLQPPFADSLVPDSRVKPSGISGDTGLLAGDKMRGQSCLADEHKGSGRREPLYFEMASSMSMSRHRGGPAMLVGGSEHRASTVDAAPVNIPGQQQECEARGSDGEGASFPLYRLNDKELSTRSLQALSLTPAALFLH